MSEIITAQEAAKKWGICERRVRILCAEGRIDGAKKIGSMWVIPEEAEKPDDKRVKSGKYIKIKQSDRKCLCERVLL